jgi:hypothetical protein
VATGSNLPEADIRNRPATGHFPEFVDEAEELPCPILHGPSLGALTHQSSLRRS